MSTNNRTRVYFQSVKTKEYLVAVINGCILSSHMIQDAYLFCEKEALQIKTDVLRYDRTDRWVWREIGLKAVRYPKLRSKCRYKGVNRVRDH